MNKGNNNNDIPLAVLSGFLTARWMRKRKAAKIAKKVQEQKIQEAKSVKPLETAK